MKRALLVLLTALPASADTRFAWSANPEPDVCAYRLYVGPSPRHYTRVVEVGCHRTVTIPEDEGFAAVTAVNSAGLESDYSVEVPFRPKAMLWRVPPGQHLIETTDSLDFPLPLWLIYAVVTGPSVYEVPVNKLEPKRFFRMNPIP